MKLYMRFILTAVLLALIGFAGTYFYEGPAGRTSADLAIAQVNGGDAAFEEMQAFERAKQYPTVVVLLLSLGVVILLWGGKVKEGFEEMAKKAGWVALFAIVVTTIGCWKQYDVPEYENVDTTETAYVVKLEGTEKEAKVTSVDEWEKLKVTAKRIRITKRWNQTGRMGYTGEWIPAVRVIKVNRSPVTREWTAGSTTGTAKKDQAIWAESKDSVGFSTGFSVSAMIEEANASKFLYKYNSKSLATVMDTEIRARVQAAFSDSAALYDLSDLRSQKSEIITHVRNDVIPFFADRGITITTLGMFGGLTYENKKIQESIDAVFIAQREKEISAALLAAQVDKNKQIEMEASALAEKERKVAQGIADGKQMLLDVAKNAGQDPAFLELRRLEVEEARIQKWDGKYPTYMMNMGSGGDSPSLMLQVPTATSVSKR